jgi:hypothetical protein
MREDVAATDASNGTEQPISNGLAGSDALVAVNESGESDGTTAGAPATTGKNCRFASVLSLDKQGIEKATKVITSRIDSTTIDRIAEEATSNHCELFFGNMTYQSEGKRINWSKNFANYVRYVAGAQSNLEFGDHVEKRLGFDASAVVGRQHHQQRKAQCRDAERVRRSSEQARTQRLVSRQTKLSQLAIDNRSGCRHKTDKVNPKDDVKKLLSRKRLRNQSKCSNCGASGHNTNDCVQGAKRQKLRKGKQLTVSALAEMWKLN